MALSGPFVIYLKRYLAVIGEAQASTLMRAWYLSSRYWLLGTIQLLSMILHRTSTARLISPGGLRFTLDGRYCHSSG